jgi:hypothetical protein
MGILCHKKLQRPQNILSGEFYPSTCNDGVDNDGDSLTDYPHDPGCDNATDDSELNVAVACDNGRDDDNDGKIDYPADPGCSSPSDTDEKDMAKFEDQITAVLADTKRHVFFGQQDGVLWQKIWGSGKQWSEKFIGGSIISNPVVWYIKNNVKIYAVGQDQALWEAAWDGKSWKWLKIGGSIQSDPAVVGRDANNIFVFVRGWDDALWQVFWNGGTWNWSKIEGTLISSSPTAVIDYQNNLRVYAKGANNRLWEFKFDGQSWSSTETVGTIISDPKAAVYQETIKVYAIGHDNQLWEATFGNFETKWKIIEYEGMIKVAPLARTGQDGVNLYALTTNYEIRLKTHYGSDLYTDWESLETRFAPSRQCKRWTYRFRSVNEPPITKDTEVYFGGKKFTYSQLPWAVDEAYDDPNNHHQYVAGYAVYSDDCGITWRASSEYLPPLKLAGIGNGVGSFNAVDTINKVGFTSHQTWDAKTPDGIIFGLPKIYGLNFINNKWSYGALGQKQEHPSPLIGNYPSTKIADNFYSPWAVRDNPLALYVYFGGWRHDVNTPVPECNIPNRPHQDVLSWEERLKGYSEKICQCIQYKNWKGSLADNDPNNDLMAWPIDSCTGDKIFLAKITGGKVNVYSGNGKWTNDGNNSANFEPVIWPGLVNSYNDPENLPYKLYHTNDGVVVKTNDKTYPYVIYFTGAAWDKWNGHENEMPFTHVGRSKDGINWEKFAILRPKEGVKMPGGYNFNLSNGEVRAYFNSKNNKIYLLSLATPATPNGTDPSHDPMASTKDVWRFFIYTIDPGNPAVVLESRKIDRNHYQFSGCQVGEVCGVANSF